MIPAPHPVRFARPVRPHRSRCRRRALPPIAPRVARGVALLDSEEPGWWEHVTRTIDVEDPAACPLGQVFGSYAHGCADLGVATDEAHAYGWDHVPTRDRGVMRADWRILSAHWAAVVADRRYGWRA